jgi:hypothetical protein
LTGDVGLVAIILGIVGAVILFGAAYFLEPYRRILLGLSMGALVGLRSRRSSIGSLIGGVLGVVLAVVVPQLARSSCRGTSTHSSLSHPPRRRRDGYGRRTLVFPGVGLFDRATGGFPCRHY